MAKDLKTLALARLSGFRHKTVKVPEWGNVSVVLREPSAQGMNVALKDAMLCWGEDEDKPEVDPFAALEDALSFAAQS